jgi:hypothetical protein
LSDVKAIDAARWLDESGLLKDYPYHPSISLRKLLRKKQIKGAIKRNGHWCHITKE